MGLNNGKRNGIPVIHNTCCKCASYPGLSKRLLQLPLVSSGAAYSLVEEDTRVHINTSMEELIRQESYHLVFDGNTEKEGSEVLVSQCMACS